jgi:hypothetical protein
MRRLALAVTVVAAAVLLWNAPATSAQAKGAYRLLSNGEMSVSSRSRRQGGVLGVQTSVLCDNRHCVFDSASLAWNSITLMPNLDYW